MYPRSALLVLHRCKLLSVPYHRHPFSRLILKPHWTLQGHYPKVLHIWLTSVPESSPYCSPFRPKVSLCGDTKLISWCVWSPALYPVCLIQINIHTCTYLSASNDPKLLLKTTKSNVQYICLACVPEFQISHHFTMGSAIIELPGILDESTKWPQVILNITRSKTTVVH